MKKFLAIFILVLLFFTSFTASILAQSFKTGEVPTLDKNETVNGDYFSWGEKVVLSGTVNGDAYLAGGDIIVDGVINGDLLAAGGDINITGIVTGNIRSAGGNILVSGPVGRSVSLAGGSLLLSNAASVGGSIAAAGGNININAPVQGSVSVASGSVAIANIVGSNVNVTAEDFTITSSARINGSVTYLSENRADIASGAVIAGTVTQNMPNVQQSQVDAGKIWDQARIGFNIFSFLAALLVGGIIIWLMPNYVEKAAANITMRPLYTLGIGFLGVILTPVVVLLFLVTVIGIPVALTLLATYLIVLYLAKISVSLVIGKTILKYFDQDKNIFLSFALGLIVLSFISFIPVVSWIVGFLVLFFGVGAYIFAKRDVYSQLRSKKLI